MKNTQRRQYEMLLRVRDFGSAHRELFSGHPRAQETFESVNTAVNELTMTDLSRLSASVAARADRKAIARKALIDVLTKVGQLARILRSRGRTIPAFRFPASRTDQGMLTAARQFAKDLAPFDAEFTRHRIGPADIAKIVAAFETAVSDRGMKRADHLAARTKIHDLLKAARLDVVSLDLIVDHVAGKDNPVRAVWKLARRVEKTRPATVIETPLKEAA